MSFISSIKDGAIKAQTDKGICASLTIAQAILESGWGKSAPGNNLFGIKWTQGCGFLANNLLTTEYINGVLVKVTASFRAYNTLNDSIYDHAKFLVDNSRYANLIGVKDYKKACTLIQQDGYATDPSYTKLLIQIIEENNLNQYDEVVPEEVKEVIEMVGAIVVYGNRDDQGPAELLADFLKCPTIDSQRTFDYSHNDPVICVGAVPTGGLLFTGYSKKLLVGTNRYETAKMVSAFIDSGAKI